MSHRTQIMLPEDLHAQVSRESAQTGLSLAEIVRQALTARYRSDRSGAGRAVAASAGAWADREYDGEAYVDGLRLGLARKVEP